LQHSGMLHQPQAISSDVWHSMTFSEETMHNKTLEPTRGSAFSSAFAVHVSWPRVAQLAR
jgi:hypothetical protein